MNILMLDIDGVLNNEKTLRLPAICNEDWWLRGIDQSYMGIDPECIDRVNQITQAFDAKIILSTNWVLRIGYQATVNWLKHYNLQAEIIGQTERKMSSCRVNEIKWTIKNFEDDYSCDYLGQYLILDDDYSVAKNDILNKKLVLTDSNLGLTEEDMRKAFKLIGKSC